METKERKFSCGVAVAHKYYYLKKYSLCTRIYHEVENLLRCDITALCCPRPQTLNDCVLNEHVGHIQPSSLLANSCLPIGSACMRGASIVYVQVTLHQCHIAAHREEYSAEKSILK